MINERLFRSIEGCTGLDGCFQSKLSEKERRCRRPVILRNNKKPKVMVITEQPGPSLAKFADVLSEVIGDMNKHHYRKLVDAIFKTRLNEEEDVPGVLKSLLGESFSKSVINRKGVFYWTHYIKCPGMIKEVKGKGVKLDACANVHFFKEIVTLKPKLILSFGKRAGEWILRKASRNKKWGHDRWIDNIYITNKKAGHSTMLGMFYHPSGRNPLWPKKKKFEKLQEKVRKKIKATK